VGVAQAGDERVDLGHIVGTRGKRAHLGEAPGAQPVVVGVGVNEFVLDESSVDRSHRRGRGRAPAFRSAERASLLARRPTGTTPDDEHHTRWVLIVPWLTKSTSANSVFDMPVASYTSGRNRSRMGFEGVECVGRLDACSRVLRSIGGLVTV
jgi:hypothetical protein